MTSPHPVAPIQVLLVGSGGTVTLHHPKFRSSCSPTRPSARSTPSCWPATWPPWPSCYSPDWSAASGEPYIAKLYRVSYAYGSWRLMTR